jgi:TolB-like protein/Tfp pilus assembly protein PilF
MTDEPLSFMARLKRHHIFRVASVYAIGAWVLIQLANSIFPDLGWPRQSVLILLVAVALLFPVVLILGWMFIPPSKEDPAKFSRWQRWHWRLGSVLSLALIALVTFSGVYLWRVNERHLKAETVATAPPSAITTSAASAATNIPAKSIAVLPFENLSPDKNNAYFAAGMREEILTRLANLGGFLVISSTSSSHFSSRPTDLRDVARQLGVATVLEGSVQRAGNKVLVNVQLIDASTDNHLWAESYQRTLDNMFGVEGEVAKKVASALAVKLSTEKDQQLAVAPTTNPAAYEAYLRGRAYETTWFVTVGNLDKAIAAYREAVALDPSFAPAWARLATTNVYSYFYYIDHTPQRLATAKRALDKALVLAPDTGETQLALGYYYYKGIGDYSRSLDAFQRALPLLPNSSEALAAIAYVERRQGHLKDALKHINEAAARDPLNADLLNESAATYIAIRDFPAALKLLDHAMVIRPKDLRPILDKAFVYQAEGDIAAAGKMLTSVDVSSMDETNKSDLVSSLIDQEILTRNYQAAIQLLRTAKPPLFFSSNRKLEWVGSNDTRLGYAERLAGNSQAAQVAYMRARTELLAAIKATPDIPYFYGDLGLCEAGLGHKTAALAAGRRAVSMLPASKDAMEGPGFEENLADIEATVGENDAAIVAIRHLLSIPYENPITVAFLRFDPIWDSIRNDPRFQALLKNYENK